LPACYHQELVEDYVERNQDNFDEFGDVAEMYECLNLDALLEKSAALCVRRRGWRRRQCARR
jgi:hypothetical protein